MSPRLFNLSSNFTVGSRIQTKYALQAKQNSIQALIASRRYKQSSIETFHKWNKPDFWPKMLGSSECETGNSCAQFCIEQQGCSGGSNGTDPYTGQDGCICCGCK